MANNSRKYSSLNINNARFSHDFTAINKSSKISELKNHSRAYLHHLFKMREVLGQRLASLNNLEFYQNLLQRLRRQ